MGNKFSKKHKYLSDVGNILDDGFVITDKSGYVIIANKVAQEFFGRSLINKSIFNFINNNDFLSLNLEKSKNHYDDFFYHELDDYLKRKLSVKIKKLSNNIYLLILTDTTHERNLERIRKDFVANVSHELRSPLTILTGFVETMISDENLNNNNLKKFLEIMNEEGKRMNGLIDDILSLSKVESEEHISPSNIISILDPINIVISSLIKSKKICNNRIKLIKKRSYDYQKLKIEGNLDEITQVFMNLIENALKYGYEDKSIKLIINQPNLNEVSVSVINKGEGIPEIYLDRLTERFFRVDKARSRKVGGTGLGLAIVKHILIKHRGELKIESIINKETTFTVILPLINN